VVGRGNQLGKVGSARRGEHNGESRPGSPWLRRSPPPGSVSARRSGLPSAPAQRRPPRLPRATPAWSQL